ncbi:MAG: AraC family transcriptional regulator [Ruminococcaceae bacterium]|nr:AraC family transcriptional regulator [Oscillospiraceae bacterium]
MFITDKEELKKYTTEHRIWQGIPGIEVTKGGRCFLTFYSGGIKETLGNYVMLLMSDDEKNFSEPIAVADLGADYRCYDPCLWIDPLGRLWFCWAVMPEHAEYAVICENPDADELVWSDVKKIGYDLMMNKPTVLSSGEWLFPLAVWNHNVTVMIEHATKRVQRGSFVYRSVDNGETIVEYGVADVPDRCFDEHMVLELNDGRLMMLVRTNYGIGVSYSWDRGKTWCKGEDSGLGGPNSRFFIRRLESGRVLLINHVNFKGRNNLTALLSDDDCKTWKWQLLLDGRDWVSYPDAKEQNGYIYITYDRERGGFKSSLEEAYQDAREILVSKITEADIMAGKLVDEGSYLAHIASKLGKYADAENNPYGDWEMYRDEEAVQVLLAYPKQEIIGKIFEVYSANCANVHRLDIKKLDALIAEFEENPEKNPELILKIVSLVRSANAEGAEEMPVVARIKEIIEQNIATEMSVFQIAERVGISQFYLSHLFKKVTGITPIAYRNELRITKAKIMLLSGNENMTEIAYVCGFSTASYFAERFTKSEGMTPTEYRKLHQ